MKNKKTILGMIIFLFITTGMIGISNVFGLDDPDYSVEIIGGHAFELFWTRNEGDCIRMEYLITGGGADLHLYIRNSTGDVIKDFGVIDDYGIRYFYVPYDDTFQFIFKNDALFTSRYLELNIDVINTITITSPISTDIFLIGNNPITWKSSGNVVTVQIQLYKNGVYLDMISLGTSNDGIYNWYIYDDDYIDDSDYQILVIDYYDNTVYDYSDYFAIECETPEVEKIITIGTPAITNTFTSGYNYIYWTSTGDISYVTIKLYKNGVFLETIDFKEYNDGTYSWYIYDDDYTDGSNYQIRVSDYNDDSVYDYSSYFTIECETIPDDNPAIEKLFWWILIISVISIITSAIIIPIVIIQKRKKRDLEEVINPTE